MLETIRPTLIGMAAGGLMAAAMLCADYSILSVELRREAPEFLDLYWRANVFNFLACGLWGGACAGFVYGRHRGKIATRRLLYTLAAGAIVGGLVGSSRQPMKGGDPFEVTAWILAGVTAGSLTLLLPVSSRTPLKSDSCGT